MRIAHTITRFLHAGAEENTAITCNGQLAAGHEVHLIAGPGSSEAAFRRLLDDGVQVHICPHLVRNPHIFHDMLALRAMRKLLQKIQPDMLHSHTSKAGFISRMVANKAGVRHVVHTDHQLPFINAGRVKSAIFIALERMAAGKTDAFIHVSRAMQDACINSGIGADKPHHVIASGMDVRAFQGEVRQEWVRLIETSVLPATITRPQFVIYVGSFEARKRQAALLPLFAEIAEKHKQAVLLLVGEGPEKERVEALAETLGLAGRVLFLGFRQDVAALLKIAHVGILTSEREGLARVLMQYALAGLPIIATHNPGAETIVKHGENGYLIPVDELSPLVGYLDRLLGDEALRAALAEASRRLDLSEWSSKRMVERIGQVYDAVMAG